MRICIPTTTGDGKKANVHGHFGSASYFTIYDTEKDVVEVIDNSNQHHSHGTCQPMSVLSGEKIDAVVCGGMGARAVQKLNEGGIKAYKAVAGTVEEIVKQYEQGGLEEITAENACSQHNCHPNILLLLFLTILCCAVTAKAKTVSKIEGIFYADSKPVLVEIVDGKIGKIIHKDKLDDANNADLYLAPGLIDHQVNGYVSVNFVGPQLSVEDVRKATVAIWKKGVTTYLPTLTTNTRELLTRNFAVVAQAAKDAEIADSIAGFHLEGPYISPVEGYRGAHNEQWIRPPDWNEFLEFYKAADNKILEVTVAPETPGAIDFIRNCGRLSVVVAIGHTAADAEQIRQAVDAGAAVSTHLGNGCANMIHRHENPLWPQLADDRLTASIICDGFHLPSEQVRTFFKVKGPQRTIIVSDMSSLAGMPPGEYSRHGRKVVITPDGLIRMPSQDVLAGSSMPICVGVGNAMKFTGCSLADAIGMASANPARLLHLDDRGKIEPGKRADIILFRLKDSTLSVQKTIIAGKVVYSAQ